MTWIIAGVVLACYGAGIAMWRRLGRRVRLLKEDQLLGQVEEYVLSDLRGGRAGLSGLGKVEPLSLKRACAQFTESVEGRIGSGKVSMSSVFRLFSDLGPIRVVVLPRSRIVLTVEKAVS